MSTAPKSLIWPILIKFSKKTEHVKNFLEKGSDREEFIFFSFGCLKALAILLRSTTTSFLILINMLLLICSKTQSLKMANSVVLFLVKSFSHGPWFSVLCRNQVNGANGKICNVGFYAFTYTIAVVSICLFFSVEIILDNLLQCLIWF